MSKDNTQRTLQVPEIQGPFNQLLKNLSGSKGERWFAELNRFLRKEETWTRTFKTYGTVEIGTHGSIAELMSAVSQVKFQTYFKDEQKYIRELLWQVNISSVKKVIELCQVSVKDLGFPFGANLKEINKRVVELGYDICSAEVFPQVLIQNVFPKELWFDHNLAMKPLKENNREHRECIFYAGRAEHSYFTVWTKINSGHHFCYNEQFFIVKPDKSIKSMKGDKNS